MRSVARLLIVAAAGVAALASGSANAEKVYHIRNAPGGNVREHYAKFVRVAAEYDRVEISGMCKSACTMVLGIVPLDRICITSGAYFMFHAGHKRDSRIYDERATQDMLASYAGPVRQWVLAHRALERVDPYTYLYAKDVTFLRRCKGS